MRLWKYLLPAVALAGAPLTAEPSAVTSADASSTIAPPKLLVAIAIDQFSADLFVQYRSQFRHGLARLSGGVVFPSAYQAHAATETCPGHSTILTGSRPARTGIIANNWFDLSATREDKSIYCAEDEHVPGSTSSRYTVSPVHLRVPALGDHLKLADPDARVAVAAGKDRAAVMMGGHHPDQRWYWSGRTFASGPQSAVPAAAGAEAARAVADALKQPRAPMEMDPVCAPRDRLVPVAGSGRAVGAGRFAREAGNTSAFRASPELDAATVALALGLREELQLGQRESTDLLIVGLSATDYVGHFNGTQGSEMCLQMLALDRTIGVLLDGLDAAGIDYLVVLTADHGGSDIPERSQEQAGHHALRADAALDHKQIGKAVAAKLALPEPVLFGEFGAGDMYIDRSLSSQDRDRALSEVVNSYRVHPHVAAAYTRDEIAAVPSPTGSPQEWSLLQRARASFDPERSGDLVVMLRPFVSPVYDTGGGYVSGHGSPWDYDRRVPLLFWRKGLAPFEQPQPVETVDILPTLAATVGLVIPPRTIDGRCLDLLDGPQTSCPMELSRRD